MSKYRFSIIVPHYDGVISDRQFMEGMMSISKSTFKDFEVLIYHDGPISRPIPDISNLGFDYKIVESKKRYNDWGHSLRAIGIREANGEYIVHFNPDNILNKLALSSINQTINTFKQFFVVHKNTKSVKDLNRKSVEVVICPIIMSGVVRVPGGSLFRTRDPKDELYMDGFPPIKQNIDCMQIVATKKAWDSIGGWSLKHEASDGDLIEKLVMKYSWITCTQPIGIHR